MGQKFFDGKSWYSLPPPISKLLRDRKFAETRQRRVLLRSFSVPWDEKKFDRKLWRYSLKQKNFRSPKLMKDWRIILRDFSALWDKKFSTKNLDNPLPLPSVNFFATGIFLKHSTEGFPCEIFRSCETDFFLQKIAIPFFIKYRNQWWNWCL